jgi:hypothetical protein
VSGENTRAWFMLFVMLPMKFSQKEFVSFVTASTLAAVQIW